MNDPGTKWSPTRYRVKAFDKHAQGHFATAAYASEEELKYWIDFLLQSDNYDLVRVEATRERMVK